MSLSKKNTKTLEELIKDTDLKKKALMKIIDKSKTNINKKLK